MRYHNMRRWWRRSHRAGLADENGHPCRRGDSLGASGGGVHLHRAGHRRGVGRVGFGGCGTRLTLGLVLLFLYAGVIALWHAFDDRKMAGARAGILVLVGVVADLPVIHYSDSGGTPCTGARRADSRGIDPAMRSPYAGPSPATCCFYDAFADADAQPGADGKRRPWVSELILKEGHR